MMTPHDIVTACLAFVAALAGFLIEWRRIGHDAARAETVASGGESCYHWSMRNLRKIFEHLGFYQRSPSTEIKGMCERIMAISGIAPDDRVLLGRVLNAVIDIADDDADKAAKKATKEG